MNTRTPQTVVAIMGPTASGKTDLALAIAREWPVTIISVDSALVYRGMDIGTAKPSRDVLAQVPHRLIDIRDPIDSYSAADFARDAAREIAAAQAEQRLPLLVGGTMLYFRALVEGLSDLPQADPVVRAALDDEMRRHGSAALHARLAQVDPVAAQKIHPNDPQRIQRALEVYTLTGRPWSELCREREVAPPFPLTSFIVAPANRAVLHQRIAQRFDIMIEHGLIDEVRALRARGDLHLSLPSMRAVGYRQVWQYLDGDFDFPNMRDQAVAATRQLAKRQLTWLRRDWGATWIDTEHDPLPLILKNLVSGLT